MIMITILNTLICNIFGKKQIIKIKKFEKNKKFLLNKFLILF